MVDGFGERQRSKTMTGTQRSQFNVNLHERNHGRGQISGVSLQRDDIKAPDLSQMRLSLFSTSHPIGSIQRKLDFFEEDDIADRLFEIYNDAFDCFEEEADTLELKYRAWMKYTLHQFGWFDQQRCPRGYLICPTSGLLRPSPYLTKIVHWFHSQKDHKRLLDHLENQMTNFSSL